MNQNMDAVREMETPQIDRRQTIIDMLAKIKQRDYAKNDKWKVRAYTVVINQLKQRTEPIVCIQDLDGIKGIGTKIKEKIQEIIDTGDLTQVHDMDSQVAAIQDMTRVFAIGPVRAKELHDKFGMKSVADLADHPELLNEKQRLGLQYYEDFEKRIPRTEMEKHASFITEAVKKVSIYLKVEIMGSYRRGSRESGDIDVLLTHDDDPENYLPYLDGVINRLQGDGYIVNVFAKGNKKFNGVCKLKRHKYNRRIDIMYTRKMEWPFALLYFTGDQQFNIIFRKLALDHALSLNEYGLKHTSGKDKNSMVSQEFRTESDVFHYLGVEYIDPQSRNGRVKFIDYAPPANS